MNRTIAVVALLAWCAVWLSILAAAPTALSDDNAFLAGFMNHEFLSFMGVVVTITLASAANLHIELNKLEDKLDAPVFRGTKRDLRHSAFTLVGALVAAIVLVIIKPLVVGCAVPEAVANGAGVTILLISVLILIDITSAAFQLDLRADD